ncbi:succinate dehydrogenase subunit 7B, mitochondrial-like [Mangifera indica]|uniref:succinate dehydrogenase subunit 7B, mitochondrial-like n=1 Tax=Mangifera indica TaxID=29780 RepID=UPI001CFC0E42|nr:succinate dehydrogenase subunit 7B, mitochondrial-like [Mangifera indica]
MAFLSNKSSVAAALRSHFQKTEDPVSLSRRRLHVEPGAREKALLAEDPILKKYKSNKDGARRVKRLGDVLTIVVVAGCCYEIYVRAVMREEARKQTGTGN